MLIVLQATFKGWMDIMYAAVDSRNVSLLWENGLCISMSISILL
jgi:hypothetical protein